MNSGAGEDLGLGRRPKAATGSGLQPNVSCGDQTADRCWGQQTNRSTAPSSMTSSMVWSRSPCGSGWTVLKMLSVWTVACSLLDSALPPSLRLGPVGVQGYSNHQYSTFNSGGIYAENNLQQTVVIDRHLSHRLKKEIRQEILSLLGLDHRPRALSHPRDNSAPKYMLELYSMLEDDADDREEGRRNHNLFRLNMTLRGMEQSVGEADMIMCFVDQAKKWSIDTRGGRLLQFDFGEVAHTEAVSGAELRVYKRPVPSLSHREPFNIKVYKMGQKHNHRETPMEFNVTVNAAFEGWVDLNVTQAVTQWTYFLNTNYGVMLHVTDVYGRDLEPSDIGLVDSSGVEDKRPFLVAFFKMADKMVHHRTKRAIDDRKQGGGGGGRNRKADTRRQRQEQEEEEEEEGVDAEEEDGDGEEVDDGDAEPLLDEAGYMSDQPLGWNFQPENRQKARSCQRRKLHVSFKDLGWQDWIIAPENYGAFFCDGECAFPLNAQMNATNHAIVQTLVHLMNPMLVPKPCCAPTKLTAISVLYFDDNYNVILKKYRNMVVRACGCH